MVWQYGPILQLSCKMRQLLGGHYTQGPVELEGQHGFGRHLDRSTFGDDLSDGARAGPGCRSKGSSFAASCDGADDGADGSAATGIFGGSFVRAHAASPFCTRSTVLSSVPAPTDGDGGEVERQVGGAAEAPAFGCGADHDLGIRAARDHDVTVGIEHVPGNLGGVGLALSRLSGIDGFLNPNRQLGSDGELIVLVVMAACSG